MGGQQQDVLDKLWAAALGDMGTVLGTGKALPKSLITVLSLVPGIRVG